MIDNPVGNVRQPSDNDRKCSPVMDKTRSQSVSIGGQAIDNVNEALRAQLLPRASKQLLINNWFILPMTAAISCPSSDGACAVVLGPSTSCALNRCRR